MAGPPSSPGSRPRTSRLAVGVFLLTFPVGCLAVPLGRHYGLPVIPIAAWGGLVILGTVAAVRIALAADPKRGGGWILAAAIIGPFLCLGSATIDVGLPSQPSPCRANMHYLSLALRMYANEHNGDLPPADRWCDALVDSQLIDGEWVFQCPEEPDQRCSYALNKAAVSAGRSPAPSTVLLFESDAGWNATGGRGLLAHRPRHEGGYNFVLCDGTMRWVAADDVDSLRWEP